MAYLGSDLVHKLRHGMLQDVNIQNAVFYHHKLRLALSASAVLAPGCHEIAVLAIQSRPIHE